MTRGVNEDTIIDRKGGMTRIVDDPTNEKKNALREVRDCYFSVILQRRL